MFEGCCHILSSQPKAEDALQQQPGRQDPYSHLSYILTGEYRKDPRRLERRGGVQPIDRWWCEVKMTYNTCHNHLEKERSEPRMKVKLGIQPAESLVRRADTVSSAVSQWGGMDMNWEETHVPEWDIAHAMLGFICHGNCSQWRMWERHWSKHKTYNYVSSTFYAAHNLCEVPRLCLQPSIGIFVQ